MEEEKPGGKRTWTNARREGGALVPLGVVVK